jgi:hypothetical protein
MSLDPPLLVSWLLEELVSDLITAVSGWILAKPPVLPSKLESDR